MRRDNGSGFNVFRLKQFNVYLFETGEKFSQTTNCCNIYSNCQKELPKGPKNLNRYVNCNLSENHPPRIIKNRQSQFGSPIFILL